MSLPRQTRLVAHGEPEEAALASWRQSHANRLPARRPAPARLVSPDPRRAGNRDRNPRAVSALVLAALTRVVLTVVAITAILVLCANAGLTDDPRKDFHPSGFSELKGRF